MRRILIPVLAILLGVLVAVAMLNRGGGNPTSNPPTPQSPATQPTAAPTPTPPTATVTPQPSEPPPQTTPPPAVTELVNYTGLRSLTEDGPAPRSIGLDVKNSLFKMKVDLVRWGAGVERITLADYAGKVDQPEHYVLEKILTAPYQSGTYTVYPFAARSIEINGQKVDLQYAAWRPGEVEEDTTSSSVTYTITIGDADKTPVLRIDRRFVLAAHSYDLQLEQTLTNLTDGPLKVVWSQNIQGDVTDDGAAYMGDRRLFVTGYFNPQDVNRVRISTTDGFVSRVELTKDYISEEKTGIKKPRGIWPNPSLLAGSELVWLASENRYFNVVTHPVVPDTVKKTADVTPLEALFPNIGTEVFPGYAVAPEADPSKRAVVFTLGTDAITIPAQQSHRLDHAVYAGPRDQKVFANPPYTVLNFDELIRYELGCTMCTFQWLAKGLLQFLTWIHWVVNDWGIAIIILVAVVRLILHPLTKKAQVNMMKMGKQMQALQPEMEKLRKKYKDDQQKLNQEMMKLYREKGMNPFNMLGCLPMFLQMPIWVALYAMLYYAIELRHQPAFYGVFQWIGELFGHQWQFLASLSSPDRFIVLFQEPVTINLWLIQLNFQSINILPLLMAVVFFFQQKFTTPPATTDQARQQQRMMKFMVLLFPIFLYSAPSGLTLYILASTAAGVVDSYLVRKHVREQEEAGTLFDKKPRKKGGFMDRMSKLMEQKQREMAEKQGQQGGSGGKGNRKKR